MDTDEGPVLVVELTYARKGNLGVELQMERALSDKDEVLDLPHVSAQGIEREQGTIGVEAKGAVEVAAQNTEGLQAIDPRASCRADSGRRRRSRYCSPSAIRNRTRSRCR